MDFRAYYAIIPATVRYDEKISANAKLLYGEITALCNDKGYCWATNQYFVDLYKSSISSIKRYIKELIDSNYIESKIVYKKGSKEIEKRFLYIKDIPRLKYEPTSAQSEHDLGSNMNLPSVKYELENNNIINNNIKENIIINNNIKEKIKKFQKPTLEQVKEYCLERNNNVDAQTFIDFYESKGWLVGKTPMKDWKAAVRTWERNRTNSQTDNKPFKSAYFDDSDVF